MATVTCALGPDTAGALLTRFLEGAEHRLDCALYEVGPAYRWALVNAARRGRSVRLLLDSHGGDGNAATAAAVVGGGGSCRLLQPAAGRGHWKLLVADGRRVAVGTGNLIWRDAPRNRRGRPARAGTREWWLFVDGAPALAQAARAAFEEGWRAGTAAAPAVSGWPGPPEARVGVPPQLMSAMSVRVADSELALLVGGAAIAGALSRCIDSARRRAWVTVPYAEAGEAGPDRLLRSMAEARRRGADVRLLLGARPSPRDAVALQRHSLPVAVMDPARCTRGHAKGAVLDGCLIAGSANWSAPGLCGEWEASLLVRDRRVAGYFARSFASDWSLADPPGLASVSSRLRRGILEMA